MKQEIIKDLISRLHKEHPKEYQKVIERYNRQGKGLKELANSGDQDVKKMFKDMYESIKNSGMELEIDYLVNTMQVEKGVVVMNVLTDYICGLCNERNGWGNSNTPKICTKCAEGLVKELLQD